MWVMGVNLHILIASFWWHVRGGEDALLGSLATDAIFPCWLFVNANQSRQINDPSSSFSFVPISKSICLDLGLLKRILS